MFLMLRLIKWIGAFLASYNNRTEMFFCADRELTIPALNLCKNYFRVMIIAPVGIKFIMWLKKNVPKCNICAEIPLPFRLFYHAW